MSGQTARSLVFASMLAPLAGPLLAQDRPVSRGMAPAGNRSSNYFARGFTLDQGPDFALALDGIPLNLPSGLKAPGFFDDGIFIPETQEGLTYRKGPYRSDQGAFAIAGSAELEPVAVFSRPMLKAVYGGAATDRFGRLVWADTRTGAAWVTYALEGTHSYRPWDDLEASAKFNAFLRISPLKPGRGWTFTLLATHEKGDGGSPPLDAPLPATFPKDDDPRQGDGYHYQRVFLGLNRTFDRGPGITDHVQAYGGAASLRHWATSTYFLREPFWGDQLAMVERRAFLGGEARRQWEIRWGDLSWTHRLGVQGRIDQVGDANIHATFDRGSGPDATPRLAAQAELIHGALFGQSTMRWGEGWHAFAAARMDSQGNHVYGPIAPTRQNRWATLLSPRFGLGYSPWDGTQIRAAWGQGFRPGNAFRDLRPMIRAHSTDLGFQTRLAGPWETSLTLWKLDLEAEAVFDANESALVLGDPSRRQGLEWFNEAKWGPWSVEACLAWSRARFSGASPGGHVPGAIPQTGLLKVAWEHPSLGLGAALTFRSFGAYALDPGNTVFTGRQNALNLRLERSWQDWTVAVEAINAFSLRKNNRAYYYVSALPHDPATLGTHTKRADPQALRLEVSRRF